MVHLGLGFLCLVIASYKYVEKFLFATGGANVGIVAWAAALTWIGVWFATVSLLSSGRRWAWLLPVAWFAVSLTALLAAISLSTATATSNGCWC